VKLKSGDGVQLAAEAGPSLRESVCARREVACGSRDVACRFRDVVCGFRDVVDFFSDDGMLGRDGVVSFATWAFCPVTSAFPPLGSSLRSATPSGLSAMPWIRAATSGVACAMRASRPAKPVHPGLAAADRPATWVTRELKGDLPSAGVATRPAKPSFRGATSSSRVAKPNTSPARSSIRL
jgi:hypothetical protein